MAEGVTSGGISVVEGVVRGVWVIEGVGRGSRWLTVSERLKEAKTLQFLNKSTCPL